MLATAGGWRGALQPTDRDAWFASYARLIDRFAGIAQRGGFDILNVGTEFESLTSDNRWRSVLRAARSRFDGVLSYAIAGSRILDPEMPWLLRHVDVIGVNAWYPMALPDAGSPRTRGSAGSSGGRRRSTRRRTLQTTEATTRSASPLRAVSGAAISSVPDEPGSALAKEEFGDAANWPRAGR